MGPIKSKTINNQKVRFLKLGIFLFPLVFIFLIILDKILFGPRNDFYLYFAEEDGPVEFSTAIFYFLSFLFSVIIGVTFIKQKKILFALLYLLFSTAFFFIAFEEISWGQRIFLLETPEFFADNEQNEMNFHNLPIINNYRGNLIFLVGFVGLILWAIFTHFDKLKNKSFSKYFVPQGFIMPYFISVILFFFGINGMPRYAPQFSEELVLYLFTWPDHEVIEFLLSVGIFIFIASKIIELKNQKE